MNATLAEKIHELLVADSAVVAICGTRSHFGDGPQNVALPYNIVTEVISVADGETHGLDDDSVNDAEDDLDATTVQISCYAATPKEAMQLRTAIRKALKKKNAMAGVVVSRFDQRIFREEQVTPHIWNAQLDAVLQHNPTT